MRLSTQMLAVCTALVLAMPAAATERCDIRYSVRLVHPGHNVDTGSEIRAFSTCVSNLTECHTHAEKLAREHAIGTPSARGGRADPDSVEILDLETADDCEDPPS